METHTQRRNMRFMVEYDSRRAKIWAVVSPAKSLDSSPNIMRGSGVGELLCVRKVYDKRRRHH